MVVFFVILVVMVLLSVGLVVPALLRGRSDESQDRDQQNVAIARERLVELEGRFDDGAIDENELAQGKAEVEQSLLDDLADAGGANTNTTQAGPWAAVVVGVLVPVLAGVLYLTLGRPDAIFAPPVKVAQAPQDAMHEGASIEAMVEQLKQRLLANPDDIEGWYMLANSYIGLKRFATAAEVFKKLREVAGDQPDLLVRQADALAMANNGVIDGESEALVLKALTLQPNHPIALWLAGIAAQRRGDLVPALEYWRRAEPLLGNDPNSQQELRAMIARAEQQVGESGATVTATTATSASPDPDAGAISIRVSLDESYADKVSPEDTVFVLARAMQGPPMPLAVIRKQVRDLPLEITLSDAMAMMPAMKLSKFDQVRVVAKVSKSGNPSTQSGDLVGEVESITPGNAAVVAVRIATEAP